MKMNKIFLLAAVLIVGGLILGTNLVISQCDPAIDGLCLAEIKDEIRNIEAMVYGIDNKIDISSDIETELLLSRNPAFWAELTAKKIELLEQKGYTIGDSIPEYVDEYGAPCDPDHKPENPDDICYPSSTPLLPFDIAPGITCRTLSSFGRIKMCCDWHDGDGEICSAWQPARGHWKS